MRGLEVWLLATGAAGLSLFQGPVHLPAHGGACHRAHPVMAAEWLPAEPGFGVNPDLAALRAQTRTSTREHSAYYLRLIYLVQAAHNEPSAAVPITAEIATFLARGAFSLDAAARADAFRQHYREERNAWRHAEDEEPSDDGWMTA